MRDGQPTKILKIFSQRRIIFVQNSKDKNSRLGVCLYSKPLCLKISVTDQAHSTRDMHYEMVLLVTYARMWKAWAFPKWVPHAHEQFSESLQNYVWWKLRCLLNLVKSNPCLGPAGPSKHLESTGMSPPNALIPWSSGVQWEKAGEHCAHLLPSCL